MNLDVEEVDVQLRWLQRSGWIGVDVFDRGDFGVMTNVASSPVVRVSSGSVCIQKHEFPRDTMSQLVVERCVSDGLQRRPVQVASAATRRRKRMARLGARKMRSKLRADNGADRDQRDARGVAHVTRSKIHASSVARKTQTETIMCV